VHEHQRVTQAEAIDDLGAHRRRRGGRQREHGRPAELVSDGAQTEVLGTEVVTPLADAVRFVDHEESGPRRTHPLEGLLVGELLGSEEQEVELRAVEPLERVAPLARP
jgi:hypothetical protein